MRIQRTRQKSQVGGRQNEALRRPRFQHKDCHLSRLKVSKFKYYLVDNIRTPIFNTSYIRLIRIILRINGNVLKQWSKDIGSRFWWINPPSLTRAIVIILQSHYRIRSCIPPLQKKRLFNYMYNQLLVA